jgi:adenylyltransferase/sulfurtransferase
MEFRTLQLQRDPACPICGDQPTIRSLIDYEQFCGIGPAATSSAQAALPPEFETTVEALKARLDRRERIWLLDVREPREFEICRIPGATLIPLGDLPHRLADVPAGDDAPDVVVFCKSGVRSAKAVQLLRQQGHTRVRNLAGGILAWISRVDPGQTAY